MKNLRFFETQEAYTAAEGTLETPNVSYIEEDGGVEYKANGGGVLKK